MLARYTYFEKMSINRMITEKVTFRDEMLGFSTSIICAGLLALRLRWPLYQLPICTSIRKQTIAAMPNHIMLYCP